jgi:hypothetical protein
MVRSSAWLMTIAGGFCWNIWEHERRPGPRLPVPHMDCSSVPGVKIRPAIHQSQRCIPDPCNVPVLVAAGKLTPYCGCLLDLTACGTDPFEPTSYAICARSSDTSNGSPAPTFRRKMRGGDPDASLNRGFQPAQVWISLPTRAAGDKIKRG